MNLNNSVFHVKSTIVAEGCESLVALFISGHRYPVFIYIYTLEHFYIFLLFLSICKVTSLYVSLRLFSFSSTIFLFRANMKCRNADANILALSYSYMIHSFLDKLKIARITLKQEYINTVQVISYSYIKSRNILREL